MEEKIILRDLIGDKLEEEFLEFDLTEIQLVLQKLSDTNPIDVAHAELLQQQSLRATDIISDYLGKIVKTVGYLETKANSEKNRASLEYKSPDGSKVTMEMRKFAGEASKEVEDILIRLAKAKGSKVFLEKKYDILMKSHYFYKEIVAGFRKTIIGYPNATEKVPGWE